MDWVTNASLILALAISAFNLWDRWMREKRP